MEWGGALQASAGPSVDGGMGREAGLTPNVQWALWFLNGNKQLSLLPCWYDYKTNLFKYNFISFYLLVSKSHPKLEMYLVSKHMIDSGMQRQKSRKLSGEQIFARKNFPDDKKVCKLKCCEKKVCK